MDASIRIPSVMAHNPVDLSLTNKTAIVCGSTSGIGRACANALAALGANILLISRDQSRLDAVKSELSTGAGQSHSTLSADFSKPAELDKALADRVANGLAAHILINNTGGPPAGQAIDATPDAFRAAFEAHLICNHILATRLVPAMKAAKYGRIINIISTSVKAPIPGLGVSNTIRGAVASWAKTLASELGPFNITVNNVLPGFTATERLTSLVEGRAKKASKTNAEIEADLKATIPLARFAEPAETAAAVAFLASPAAAYISGINLPVDGGRLPTL